MVDNWIKLIQVLHPTDSDFNKILEMFIVSMHYIKKVMFQLWCHFKKSKNSELVFSTILESGGNKFSCFLGAKRASGEAKAAAAWAGTDARSTAARKASNQSEREAAYPWTSETNHF